MYQYKNDAMKITIYAKLLAFPLLAVIVLLLSLAIVSASASVVYVLWALGINLLCIEPLLCVLCGIWAARHSANIWIAGILNAGVMPLTYILLLFVLAGEPETLVYGGVWFLWLFCLTIIQGIISGQKMKKAKESMDGKELQ